jgi:hypothetical protein
MHERHRPPPLWEQVASAMTLLVVLALLVSGAAVWIDWLAR